MAEIHLGGILLHKGTREDYKWLDPNLWFSLLSWHVSFLFSSAPSFWRERKPQCCFTTVSWLSRSPSCLVSIDKTAKRAKIPPHGFNDWQRHFINEPQMLRYISWLKNCLPEMCSYQASVGQYLNGRSVHTYHIIFLWAIRSQRKGLNPRNSLQ